MTDKRKTARSGDSTDKHGLYRLAFAGILGNVLEWYDFAVYGFLAPILGKLFFPADDAVASLLSAFAVLAVGYASRPLGSVIFGHIGDKLGRKPALMISVVIMGSATLGIAVLPDHDRIGDLAPVLLVLLRSLQGISVAGELPDSITLLAEQAEPERRGTMAGLISFGANCGFLLGSGVVALVSNAVSEHELYSWGWRIPFLLGASIAVGAVILRRQIPESPVMTSRVRKHGSPVIVALRTDWRAIVTIICLVLPTAIGYFMMFVYAASYLTGQMHFSTARAFDINTINLFAMTMMTLVSGVWSDSIGRRPLLFFVAAATFLVAWPLWWLMHQDYPWLVLTGQLGFALLNGIGWAVICPAMVELASRETRCSTLAIGYNLCLGLFGGTTPLVATYLVARTADDFAPVYYLMAAAVLSFFAVLRVPEMKGKALSAAD